MREQADVSSGLDSGSAGGAESGTLYIITLSSSTAPVPLEAPAEPELAGLAVFRSRRVEDGRDRFRLHLGYFDSTAAAEAVLPVVRRHYPAAWIGPAPSSGMGSLDDTSVTQFKFIKAPNTIQRDAAPAPKVASHAPVPARAPKAAPSPSASGLPALAQKAVAASPARASREVAGAKPAKPASKASPAARAAAAPKPAPSKLMQAAPLKDRQVLDLLESPPVMRTAAPKPVMQPVERAAVIGAIQRFAVQIVWSMDPVDLARVPKLAIFDAYTLYKVQVDRAGRRWYGLRLGFFGDPVSARQVALYARSDFTAAAVVPVSDRECQRAEQAAITAMPSTPAPKKPQDRITLIDDSAGQPRDVPRALRQDKPTRSSQPAPAGRPQPKGVARKRTQTPQEMAEELEMAPDFGDSADPLNDSGVRHLAVEIVSRKSGLGRLFHRGSKRR